MQEELDLYLETAEETMQAALAHYQRELVKVRTGKASPDLVAGIMVKYYGTPTPLHQVANISTADARTLLIKPWERNIISDIENAIFAANIGLTPQNDGQSIRLSIPPLTQDRRRDLAKQAKNMGEDAKISIRNARRDAMEEVKKSVKNGLAEDMGKRYEATIKDFTTKYTEQVDKVFENKEKEIMTV